MRLAHVSDLHFGCPSFRLDQFFSKQWFGNLSFFIFKRNQANHQNLQHLLPIFLEQEVSHLVITGDLSTTSCIEEFTLAKQLIDTFEHHGIQCMVVPGNHDHYTKEAYHKKLFYDFFPDKWDCKSSLSLREDQVTCTKVGPKQWLVGLDTARSTGFLSAHGFFSTSIETRLQSLLKSIPLDHQIILINHFPFLYQGIPYSQMRRTHALKRLLQQTPSIKAYLNGHTHTQSIIQLTSYQLPIAIDSGCTSSPSGHFHILDWQESSLDILVYTTTPKGWVHSTKKTYFW